MKARERVLRAFRKMPGLPDRVPIQFELCRKHIEYFSDCYHVPVDITENIFDDVTWRISANELRLKMGCDVVTVGASTAKGWSPDKGSDGTWYNEYNMKMRQGAIYVDVVGNPLADISTVQEAENYQFPDPFAAGRYDKAEELISKYKEDYVVIGDIEVTIFSLAQQLTGIEQFFCDLQLGEAYIDRLLERSAEFQTSVGLELIRRGVDIIWPSDDFGSQSSLLISPEVFRKHIKPHYVKMNKIFKQANPDIIIAFHSDGAVSPLFNDFIEMGFDVFNPIQPGVPGHGPQEVKDFLGDKMALWGGIDQQELLSRGTDEELEADIVNKINIMGKNGGYMVAPAHIIQSDVTPERVLKFIDLCKKHGAIY